MLNIFQWNDIINSANPFRERPAQLSRANTAACDEKTLTLTYANDCLNNKLTPVFSAFGKWRRYSHSVWKPRVTVSRSGVHLFSAYVADNWLTRLRGLFAITDWKTFEALWIYPCSSVHSMGLKYAIDVAFIDKSGRVLRCMELKPFSIALCLKAHSVIEMRSGSIQKLNLRERQLLSIRYPLLRSDRLTYPLKSAHYKVGLQSTKGCVGRVMCTSEKY